MGVITLVSGSGVDFYRHFGANVKYHYWSGQYLLGGKFPELANLDTYANTNNLVVLYPQAIASVIPYNPEGCWDWRGYDGPNFAVKSAPQMVTIVNMVHALGG